ncbi:MAG: hypothetical protein CMH83_20405 [Nocardioides sp.]|nr:hypothetical protein [Nocardioides sp.]
MTPLDRLYADPVLDTVRRLERRIGARFPERDLRRVAGELATVVADVQTGAADVGGRVRRARVASRVLVAVVLVATAVLLALGTREVLLDDGAGDGLDWVPLIESAVNDLVFAGLALWFLYSLPERMQRGEVLRLLHRLRSLAHIVDMHQLTKDPERLRDGFRRTSESVDPGLGRDEMEYYLDYCSELLSLVGKAAALCAEESQDAVVLDTVNSIESMTSQMSREIWQKIALLPS